MAVLVGSALGNFRGKIGNLYARIRGGKTIFSVMPQTHGKATEQQLELQQRFQVAVKFAKEICKNADIKHLFSKGLKGFSTAYNNCVSRNYKHVALTKPTTNNIVSQDGFTLAFSSAELSETNFTAIVPALNTYTYLENTDTDVSFVGTIVFTDPMSDGIEEYAITPVRKDVASYNFAGTYTLSIPFDPVQQKMQAMYGSKFLLLTVVIKNANGNITQNSKTLNFQ